MFNNILHVRSRRSFIARINNYISLRLKLIKSFKIAFLELIDKHSVSLIKTSCSKNSEFNFAKFRNILNQSFVT